MNTRQALQISAARSKAADGTARRIREAAGLKLWEVASVIGVDGPTLSRWERGQRRPWGPAAIAWVELLDRLEQETQVVS